LISLQWHVLVLTLRLAVYTLFGKARSNLDKNFRIPKIMNFRTLMFANTHFVRLSGSMICKFV